MEIDWEKGTAVLDPHEQAALGEYEDKVYSLDFINRCIFTWRNNLTFKREHLDDMRAMDDDELTHAERAAIGPKLAKLDRNMRVIETMAEQILAGELDGNSL